MAVVREFITYTNWAYLDNCFKNKNYKPCDELEYDDIYLAAEFRTDAKQINPVVTMFRTRNQKEAGTFVYNIQESSYDYFFYGRALSGYAKDALEKFLRSQACYGEYALYINTVSPDNLLFNGKVSIIDLK